MNIKNKPIICFQVGLSTLHKLCFYIFQIRVCLLSAPDTFHGSMMVSCGVYAAMKQMYDEIGEKVVVYLAFNIGDWPFLIKSSQKYVKDAHILLVNRDATSVRQLSQWGVQMIHGPFIYRRTPCYTKKRGPLDHHLVDDPYGQL